MRVEACQSWEDVERKEESMAVIGEHRFTRKTAVKMVCVCVCVFNQPFLRAEPGKATEISEVC